MVWISGLVAPVQIICRTTLLRKKNGVTQNTEKAPKNKYITNKQINKLSRQHSRPNYAATQTEGLLIRGRTGLSASPPRRPRAWSAQHSCTLTSGPGLETRPDILRLCDIKKKKNLNKRNEGDGGCHTGTGELCPEGGDVCAPRAHYESEEQLH